MLQSHSRGHTRHKQTKLTVWRNETLGWAYHGMDTRVRRGTAGGSTMYPIPFSKEESPGRQITVVISFRCVCIKVSGTGKAMGKANAKESVESFDHASL